MPNEYLIMAQSAVEAIRPVLLQAGGAVAASTAGSAVWDWVKGLFKRHGHEKIVEAVETNPTSDLKWNVLAAILADVLEENPALAKELAGRLAEVRIIKGTQEVSNVKNSKIVQQMGNGNKAEIS